MRRDWPCDLLIDILNAMGMGNCRLRSVNGREEEEVAEINLNRGMNAGSPAWTPVRILPSMTLDLRAVTINLVPLHRPAGGSRLRRSILGQPILSVIEWTGIPDILMVFRYSTGIS